MVRYLKEHVDVFAWTPQEMPGIELEVICHHLNIDPQRKPVIQKKRWSAIRHTKAVIEEVKRLLKADAIKEVYYPEWVTRWRAVHGPLSNLARVLVALYAIRCKGICEGVPKVPKVHTDHPITS